MQEFKKIIRSIGRFRSGIEFDLAVNIIAKRLTDCGFRCKKPGRKGMPEIFAERGGEKYAIEIGKGDFSIFSLISYPDYSSIILFLSYNSDRMKIPPSVRYVHEFNQDDKRVGISSLKPNKTATIDAIKHKDGTRYKKRGYQKLETFDNSRPVFFDPFISDNAGAFVGR